MGIFSLRSAENAVMAVKCLRISRSAPSGSRRAIMHQRRAYVEPVNGRVSLRIILDRFSVEVFVNGGEKVMSMTLETETSADRVSFYCDGCARMSVRKYTIGV